MKYAPDLRRDLGDENGMLREMSLEVDRISRKLAKLMDANPEPFNIHEDSSETNKPQSLISRTEVRAILKARRARYQFFPAELFADPAWDILLHLFQAEMGQHRASVSSTCSAAEVPQTTGLRWLKSLADQNLIVRRPDPFDGRRIFLELTPTGSTAMQNYFRATAGERRAGQG